MRVDVGVIQRLLRGGRSAVLKRRQARGLHVVESPTPTNAQTDPLFGQLFSVGYDFCPQLWAEANGALIAVQSNPALVSRLGTIYGGDGRTAFAQPDLWGRTVVGAGASPTLPAVRHGDVGGSVSRVVPTAGRPRHSHGLMASEDNAATSEPAGGPRTSTAFSSLSSTMQRLR
ncbi:phage tail protein [Roseivivax marinus]|uniref:phage tail protein n=1 Tax=Roseivivax marinus TaxID=1379903 RepID=UPI003CC7D00F